MAVCLVVGIGCSRSAPAKAHQSFDAAAWAPPSEAEIPNDSLGASIRRGLALLRFTPESLPTYATSSLRCTSCHELDGRKATAAPLTGAHARFPKYLTRSGAVIALADRVNYCFTRSLAGNAIPSDSREMEDILAYLAFISKGVPIGAKVMGADGLLAMKDTLAGDTAHGSWMLWQPCTLTRNNRAMLMSAITEDDYVRTPQGWRMRRMGFTLKFITPFDRPWSIGRNAVFTE